MLTITFGKTFSDVIISLVIYWKLRFEHAESGVEGSGAQPPEAGRQGGGQAREEGGGQGGRDPLLEAGRETEGPGREAVGEARGDSASQVGLCLGVQLHQTRDIWSLKKKIF